MDQLGEFMFEYWGLAFLIPRVTAGYSVLYSSVLDISKFKLHHALSPPSPLGLTLWALVYCKSSTKSPGGLFISNAFEGVGVLNRDGESLRSCSQG